MVLFYTLHTTKKEKEHEKTGFWNNKKTEKKALLYTLSNKNGNGNQRNRLRRTSGIGSRSG